MRSTRIGVTLAFALVAAVGCSDGEPNGGTARNGESPSPESSRNTPTATESSPNDGRQDRRQDRPGGGPPPVPRVRGTVASDLTTPWGLVFLEDDSALVSERNTGRILRVQPSGDVRRVGTISVNEPPTYGEGGLLGIAFRDDTLFAYRSVEGENQVIAMSYDPDGGGGLGEPRVLVDDIPQADFHNGGRMIVGPDGYLYVATGDGKEPSNAQDLDSLGGKILRITTDGEPAPGNPFEDSPVYSYGHRNIEGLAFDEAGRLWASEFGEDTWDELNLIRPGENYGWPEVEGEGTGGGKFRSPVHVWSVDEASPAGLAYADGDLWMAALNGERLWRIPVSAKGADGGPTRGEPRAFFTEEYGRLRTVVPAPDGSLWLTTSNTDGRDSSVGVPENDDRILRVELTGGR